MTPSRRTAAVRLVRRGPRRDVFARSQRSRIAGRFWHSVTSSLARPDRAASHAGIVRQNNCDQGERDPGESKRGHLPDQTSDHDDAKAPKDSGQTVCDNNRELKSLKSVPAVLVTTSTKC